MEELKQEIKPKTRRKPVRKEKNVEQVQVEQVKPTTTQNIKSNISDVEVAKKLINIYQSAQDRKLQFNLSFEYVRKMLEYKTCYYTNKIFTEDGANARSFDRVDSDKGYIEGNVVACTIDINGKKSNLSFDEISCLYQKLIKKKIKDTPNKEVKSKTIKETNIDEFFSLDNKEIDNNNQSTF
jgi:hypothetical protein